MTVETYEVVLLLNQPGNTLNPLLSMLQQLLSRPLTKNSRAVTLLEAKKILVIDTYQERARRAAQLLASVGYKPFVVSTSLDAYTLFLQGTFQPFAIILSGEESPANRFFLTRLSQQYLQRYDWSVPFIRLRFPPSAQPDLRSTGPLAQSQHDTLSRSTLPLGNTGDALRSSQSPYEHQNKLQKRGFHPTFPLQIPLTPAPPASEKPPTYYALKTLPSSPLVPLHTTPPVKSGPISLVFSQPLIPPASAFFKGTEKMGEQKEKISLIGLSLGRYHLQSIIGGNPLGDVYLTYDRLREHHIALKVLQTDMIPASLLEHLEESSHIFQKELDLLQRIEHPYLSRVMSGGKSYMGRCQFTYKTMPYYSEGSLATWLNQAMGKSFSPAEVAPIILQLADGLQYLHDHGNLYRNFKLTNILIANETRNMRDLHVVLSDLAIAQDMLHLPKNAESYRYLAPEQWDGEDFTSSDQYGLAIIAYELLTGRAPFQGNSDVIIRRMQLKMVPQGPSVFNPQVSPLIDRVILRALSKRPAERFESVNTFATTLERASL